MAGSDFNAYKANVAGAADPHGQLWISEVTKAPAAGSALATVRAIHGAGSSELALGDAPWPQPAGKLFPTVGDKCLVALDDQRSPWIVGWLAPDWPGPAVPATPTAFTANTLVKTSLATTTFTKVKLNATHDPGGNFNAAESWYVVPADGYYQVNGRIRAEAKALLAVIRLNGSSLTIYGEWNQALTSETIAVVAGIIFCKAGDHIELCGYHETGAPRETALEEVNTGLSIVRVDTGAPGPPGPGGTVERVASLPLAPKDGQEVDYIAAANLKWRLRYNAASTSAYKWESVGGPASWAYAGGGAFTLASAAFVYQAVAGSPTYTVPLAGDYWVGAVSQVVQLVGAAAGAARQLNLGVGKSITEIYGAWTAFVYNEQFNAGPFYATWPVEGLKAGDVLKLYAAGNNTLEWSTGGDLITLLPIRVG